MKSRISYFVFPIAVLLLVMSLLHSENVRGRLGKSISETSWMVHLGVLSVIVLGAGYQCVKQAATDLKGRRVRRTQSK
jgi:hypothetical protein